MAAVKARGDLVVFASGNQIRLHDLCKGTRCVLHLPESPNNAKNNNTGNSAETPSTKNGDKNVDQEENQTTEKNDQSEKKESSTDGDVGPNRTLSFAFSKSAQLFAVSDDRKQLHLYQKSDNDEASWTLLTSRSVVRRSSCVLFTRDEKEIILGDKSGDVYKFSVKEPTEPGQLMMGHLSVLLDMALVDNDRYLITCDRDEKIRVSLFPNTYNIHCYCLGHTDFLTSLVYVSEAKAIISGGGDGTIRSWDLEGKPLHCLNHGVTRSPEENKEETNNNTADSNVDPSSSSSSSSKNNRNTNNNSNNLASVKCMTFDPRSKTVAVSFDQSTVLQLYKIEMNDEQNFEIRLCDQRQLPSHPWDIEFLTNSRLLVLSPLQEGTVLLFDCSGTSVGEKSTIYPKISECLLQQQPKLQEFLKTVNSDWAFFEPSVKIVSLISSLPKSKMDNMSDYLERKEQQVKKKFQPKGKRKNPDLEKSTEERESSGKKSC